MSPMPPRPIRDPRLMRTGRRWITHGISGRSVQYDRCQCPCRMGYNWRNGFKYCQSCRGRGILPGE